MKKRSIFLNLFTKIGIFLVILIFLSMICSIFLKGLPFINKELFFFKYNSENLSLFPSLINTFTIVVIAISLSTITGVCSAIYLEEFADKNKKWVAIINLAVYTLAGIPSVIYGLFGYLFFVIYLKFAISLLAGAATVSIMILPIIIKISQEAIKTVPLDYKLGSYALGADKVTTLRKIILPYSKNGILVAIILSIGRIVGESACFIYTSGTIPEIANLMNSGRTLTLHMFVLTNEGLYVNQAYATACILIFFILAINIITKKLYKRS